LEKKKLLVILLVIAAVVVISTITIPNIVKKFSRPKTTSNPPEIEQSSSTESKGASSESKSEEVPVAKSEGASDTSSQSVQQTNEEGNMAKTAESQASGEGTTDPVETKWMSAFLSANRTWGRSPFLRQGEGMGKILIMSSPSAADIFLDGVKMPNQTNWLTPLTLPPKKYILEIKKEGYFTYRQELIVTSGIEEFRDVNTINVTLEKKPIDAEEVAGEIWRQLKRPALYVSMIVFDEEKPSALITEYDPAAPPPGGEALSNRVVFEGDKFTLPGSNEESKRSFLVKNIYMDHVILEDTLVNWDYRLEIYKEAK
jgi:hypothetical protein